MKASAAQNGGQASPPLLPQTPQVRHIELNLTDVEQLFNTMDPSPFHDKDLDHDAEEFILSWAQEFHRHEPIGLIIHLERFPREGNPARVVADAVHNYFAYRARMTRLEFRRLMKQGRTSLLVGLSFLLLCLGMIEIVVPATPSAFAKFLSEGLIIVGWVAMWKPMEIYLYDWWPLRFRGQIFEKLSQMPVEVRARG